MGTIYERGGKLYIGFRTAKGWRYRNTGYLPHEKAKAQRALGLVEAELATGTVQVVAGRLTVAQYAVTWHETRRARGLMNAHRDEARFTAYVLPSLGALRLVEVRPLHVRQLVAKLRADGRAPRTVLSTYGLVRRLFADAVADELLASSPCALKRGDLPRKADADPRWRARALFDRDEVVQLVSDTRIPLDRRVVYGLGCLAGLREGEISALRCSGYDATREPLGCLYVEASYTRANGREKGTKSGRPRQVPVHPVLAELLREWLEQGFEELFGRPPMPDDLLVPSHHGTHRTDNAVRAGLVRDLGMLGFRHRRFHDTRRTFISLARTDEANPDVLRTLTHDQTGDVFDQYTSFTWATACAAVSALRVVRASVKAPALASGGYFTATSTEETTMQTAELPTSTACPRRDSKSPESSPSRGQVVEFTRGPRGSAPPKGAVGLTFGSKRTSAGVTDELRAAADAFERTGNAGALASRLRIVLAQLRGGAR